MNPQIKTKRKKDNNGMKDWMSTLLIMCNHVTNCNPKLSQLFSFHITFILHVILPHELHVSVNHSFKSKKWTEPQIYTFTTNLIPNHKTLFLCVFYTLIIRMNTIKRIYMIFLTPITRYIPPPRGQLNKEKLLSCLLSSLHFDKWHSSISIITF